MRLEQVGVEEKGSTGYRSERNVPSGAQSIQLSPLWMLDDAKAGQSPSLDSIYSERLRVYPSGHFEYSFKTMVILYHSVA